LAFHFRTAIVQLANVASLKVVVAAVIRPQAVVVVQMVAESLATMKRITVRAIAIHVSAIWGLALTRFQSLGLWMLQNQFPSLHRNSQN
jgi:hypothetical protein